MKQIKNILRILSIVMFGIVSCSQKDNSPETLRLTEPGTDATTPFLTKDNKGNPVLCWAEKSRGDSVHRLRYSVYDRTTDKFADPVTVNVSAGMSTAPESMGKVAFRSDNTVIAVFGKAFKNEKNPFASAIYYTSSPDKGKSWSAAQFLHSDTSHSYGRSFFDIAPLKNGEVAAIWLDGRFGKTIKGSGLFYAVTGEDRKFGRDTCLYKGTCECCRTDILQDQEGNIHIAYRSILFPVSSLGKQVRDMVYSFSKDDGKTFSPAKVISEDNWAIEGCPHTGPSLAVNPNGINAVWFTAGGSSGLHHTLAPKMGARFQNRRLISPEGKHPQIVALKNGTIAMVCEEGMSAPSHQPKSGSHTMGNMSHAAAGNARVVLRLLHNGNENKQVDITDGQHADHHAVLTETGEKLLVAWTREEEGGSAIYYSIGKFE